MKTQIERESRIQGMTKLGEIKYAKKDLKKREGNPEGKRNQETITVKKIKKENLCVNFFFYASTP